METIIVPTDFSPAAKNATFYAGHLAKYFSSKLILVNAVSLPLAGYDSYQPLDMIAALQATAVELLEKTKSELISHLGYDPGIECIAAVGSPYELIKEVSNNHSADLIVMGMTGDAGKLKEHIIGSNAVDVAKKIGIPVFVVPEKASYHTIKKIAYACDIENAEETWLHIAKYFCIIFNAKLELITVKETDEELASETLHNNPLIEKRFETIEHKSIFLKDRDVANALNVFIQLDKPDILMLNPKRHSIFQKMFTESVTKKMLFHSDVPLLVIR